MTMSWERVGLFARVSVLDFCGMVWTLPLVSHTGGTAALMALVVAIGVWPFAGSVFASFLATGRSNCDASIAVGSELVERGRAHVVNNVWL